ncbi:hypothetical protein Lal_00050120 [Lupinus albus]|uniref:Putative ent-kaurene synthase n=1 Tax=Lupinus albus TaxID=3870 RepID=A0A6A4PMK2_LUPAL|nr:putative ent-kaurene synthase [Lupinus albus]KAF1867687.1 hypothetical protein Lal_00050120 [Lupinus albus]
MESTVATPLHTNPPQELKYENGLMAFDKDVLQNLQQLPKQFRWPSSDLVATSEELLNEPLIDLEVLTKGDEAAIAKAAELVRNACMKHGFFQVTNHGVDQDLINAAYQETQTIFNLPLSKKLSANRKPGTLEGYSSAHGDRFTAKLPWKETYTFIYNHNQESSQVVDFITNAFGEELHHTGMVYQKYCEAMEKLSHAVLELLAISLGVDRLHYKNDFDNGHSLMRCNSYPSCKESSLTLGTGPHNDPTGITLLHQDQVGGLEAFVDQKWLAVHPNPDAFVINIGDTFMAMTNGKFKSCLHRVLVNNEKERMSLSCFVNPNGDKIVRPPNNLFSEEEPRKYPDFTWNEYRQFTLKYHRADADTLHDFVSWIRSSKPSNF